MSNTSTYLLISDAAKEVKVESHVLRYWEEELQLPIKRNELGHRYYTEEDVERFRQIKSMKERGLQLKAIKMILRDGKLEEYTEGGGLPIEIVAQRETALVQESREEKSRRLQYLLQQLIRETLQENNQQLCQEIKESVVKELDYQFRTQEERQEERDRLRDQRDEEYYHKMDELLRKKSREKGRNKVKKAEPPAEGQQAATPEKAKKKRHFIF